MANLQCFCKSSSALQICLLDSVYRLMGIMQWLLSSQELYGNMPSWRHLIPLAHSAHQQIFAEWDGLAFLLETLSHLGSSNTICFLWLLLFNLLFSCQSVPYESILYCLFPRVTSLLPPSWYFQLLQLSSTCRCLTNMCYLHPSFTPKS